jgi:hypothetical protein
MVLFVAALAQRFEVAPIVPPMGSVSPLHDVVHFLACEPASVAGRVMHKPVAPNALPVATAEACDMIGLKAPRVGNLWPRVEDWYSHVGIPRQSVVGRLSGSSIATACGWIA